MGKQDKQRTKIIEELLSGSDTLNGEDTDGASLLDIQRGVFNILQGAAYRVCRIKYAIDYHTHERDANYPYLFSDFVKFAKFVIEMYKSLNVVDRAHHNTLDNVWECLSEQEKLLRAQVESWNAVKQKQFDAREKAVLDQLCGDGSTHKKPHENVHAVEHKSKKLLRQVSEGILHAPGWIRNSMPTVHHKKTGAHSHRHVSLVEGFGDVDHSGDAMAYLDHHEQVLLDSNDEKVPGCKIPVSFWYQDFMPKLLAACSVGARWKDDNSQDKKLEKKLDAWLKAETKLGRFDKYGKDVVEGWSKCSIEVKLNLKRAWRLTRHYLTGLQKLRERGANESVNHRETGDLSQYVAFLDVFLGKRFVEKQEMRMTFPYFIGPSTWTFHHAVAERAAGWIKSKPKESGTIVRLFKAYFTVFVKLYPCPYCRHHLNEFVVQNKETQYYPVEYLFVGWEMSNFRPTCETTLEEKLAYIKDGSTLRLFVWKLHNAVNSSIERSEEWYHVASSVNTSRYWPSIEAMVHRAKFQTGLLVATRLDKVIKVLEAAMRLAVLKEKILSADAESLPDMEKSIKPLIRQLDEAIVASGYLQKCFSFRPELVDPVIPASSYDESFVRHEHFSLT